MQPIVIHIDNAGELSKPATVLLEKISDAIGGLAKPWQIERVAKAEGKAEIIRVVSQAEVEKIKAISQIEITELQRRAVQRFFVEEAKHQDNIETIITKALPELKENAKPQDMENDWITNFFDKCRLISDEEMQVLWSKILAGEANSPGTYSKRTVNFLNSLDQYDATLFQSLCKFSWTLEDLIPLIYNTDTPIYNKYGINFSSLTHLDEIGLISLKDFGQYTLADLPKSIPALYYGTLINIEFEKESNNVLDVGLVVLSKIGQELAPICKSKAIPEFLDYVLEEWLKRDKNLRTSSLVRLKDQFPPLNP